MAPLTQKSQLADRLRAVHARGRISEALLGVVLDVYRPFARDQLSPEEYDRLCERIRGPVRVATDDALELLMIELTAESGRPELELTIRTERVELMVGEPD